MCHIGSRVGKNGAKMVTRRRVNVGYKVFKVE